MELVGQQLGHYRIVRLIGQGGMGEVYLAEDTRIPRQVAVKVVRNDPNAEALQQGQWLFQREMKAIAQLDHPHILSFHDFGKEPVANGSIIYMVMPYRPEGSLADWLAQRGSHLLPPQDIGHMITQAASALQHAHDRNIVHRDVKPSNFLVHINADHPTRPDLFLVDFGIARVMSATSTTTTLMVSNSICGTARYMPPEQWNGEVVSATDQYALAIMAYQLLAGQPPFQGLSEQQLMVQHMTVPPEPPSKLNACLSPAIDAVILRALAKKADERFPTIKAFAVALQQALDYTDLRATLAITRDEALQGGSRTITLSDKREVRVAIPPNAQDGQVLYLLDHGMSYCDGGQRGPLLLTLSLSTDAITNEPATVSPTVVTPLSPLPPSKAILPPYQAVSAPLLSGAMLPANSADSGSKPSNRRTMLLVTVVLLLIVSIVLAATVFVNHAIVTNNANATATAQSIVGHNATVIVLATATAQIQATATAIADPYPPAGSLVLTDQLSHPSAWSNNSDANFGGQCQFVNGAYQISQSPPKKLFYCNDSNQYSNFAFEVKMTINQGDCGGLMIRYNSSSNYYGFEVCQGGSYGFYKGTSTNTSAKMLTSGNSLAIKQGTGQMNVIAVVANGSSFDLYINNQHINRASDSAYSQGQIGLFADAHNNATTVTYQDARVWTI